MGVELPAMHHGHIVAMIDACLERLQAARKILSTANTSSSLEALLETSPTPHTQLKKVRPAIRIKRSRKDELKPSLFAQIPEIESPALTEPTLAPVAESAPAPTRKAAATRAVIAAVKRPVRELQIAIPALRRKHTPLPSALVSPVPSGPVFVSASQVRENTQKRTEAKAKPAAESKPTSSPLTAEMLAKRWIQSTGF